MNKQQILASFKGIKVFETLPESVQKKLLEKSTTLSFAKRETLFEEGSTAKELMLITSGSVKFRKKLFNSGSTTIRKLMSGTSKTFSFFSKGDIIGLEEFLAGGSEYSYSCDAIEECEVVLINQAQLKKYMKAHSELAYQFQQSIINERNTQLMLVEALTSTLPIEEKSSFYILFMLERLRTTKKVPIIPLNINELANAFGIARENCSRLLTILKDLKLVEVNRQEGLQVIDYKKMKKIAGLS